MPSGDMYFEFAEFETCVNETSVETFQICRGFAKAYKGNDISIFFYEIMFVPRVKFVSYSQPRYDGKYDSNEEFCRASRRCMPFS